MMSKSPPQGPPPARLLEKGTNQGCKNEQQLVGG